MRRLVIMLSITAAVVGCGVAINYLLDPYGAWGTGLIDSSLRTGSKHHLTVPYLLRTARPSVVLIGSSRVATGMRIEQGARGSFMNAGIEGCSIPELVEVADLALKNPSVKKIIWGLDFYQFDQGWYRDDPDLDARVNGSYLTRFTDTLLSLSALDDGTRMLAASLHGPRKMAQTYTAEVPWPMPLICSQFRQQRARGLVGETGFTLRQQVRDYMPDYSRFRLSQHYFDQLSLVVERARRRGVQVILIVSPMSEYEMELLWQGGAWQAFQEWKRRLAALGPFWDFSGFTPMSRQDLLFWDAMHYKPSVGHMMLRMVLGLPAEPCDPLSELVVRSGAMVSSSSLEQELARQESMRESVLHGGDQPYATFVAEIMRQRKEAAAQNSHQTSAAVGW